MNTKTLNTYEKLWLANRASHTMALAGPTAFWLASGHRATGKPDPCLCFKPQEYILITIFKENNVCCLCDTIPLHCFRDQIYFKYIAWIGCISVGNHNWSYEPSWNENCQIEKP